MTWGSRVGIGQPDVERHNASLGSAADENEDKGNKFCRVRNGCKCVKGEAAGVGVKKAEPGKNKEGSRLGKNKIEIAGISNRFFVDIIDNEEE